MARTVAYLAIFLAALLLSSPSASAARTIKPAHDIPAVFAFGDSTLDSGNNNRLITLNRADHAPYGRDFPGGASTGRFTDGKLITDYIVSALGIKDLLPAYHPDGLAVDDAATGASFASGGSGLDDMTSNNALVRTFTLQINDFQELLSKIGEGKAAKALFVLSAGTNDVFMNYYLMPFRVLNFPTIDQYHDYLIGRFQSYIKSLYNMGARRFIVAGMPPVGCLPVSKSIRGMQAPFGSGGCFKRQNDNAERYNTALQKMLSKLEANSTGAHISYVNIYTPLMDMANDPHKYGFTEVSLGCCGTGLMETGAICTNLLPQCMSPSKYMFFDSVHPSQATYKALADQVIKDHVSQFTRS